MKRKNGVYWNIVDWYSNKKVGWVAGGAKVEELCGESFAFTQFVPNVGSSWYSPELKSES